MGRRLTKYFRICVEGETLEECEQFFHELRSFVDVKVEEIKSTRVLKEGTHDKTKSKKDKRKKK